MLRELLTSEILETHLVHTTLIANDIHLLHQTDVLVLELCEITIFQYSLLTQLVAVTMVVVQMVSMDMLCELVIQTLHNM